MKKLLSLTAATLLVISSPQVVAQVYQGVDEEGNTVFSDRPIEGAKPVELQQTNSADSVEVRPRPEPEPETARKSPQIIHLDTEGEEQPSDAPYYGTYEENERRGVVGSRPKATPLPAGGGGGGRGR